MAEISSIGVLTALGAGVVSFLSPCVLPLVPGYISYVAGHSVSGERPDGALAARLPAVGLSLCFVLGFSTVFIILGASATALGQLLLAYRYELNIVGGVVVIAFGVFLLGLLRPTWLLRELRIHPSLQGGQPASAYVLGFAFAFGWTPCIGPILGAILTVSAASATAVDGVALLGLYSLGLGIPFLLATLFADELSARIRVFRQAGRWLQAVAGAILILMGLAMVTGRLAALSYWFLETFPALADIG